MGKKEKGKDKVSKAITDRMKQVAGINIDEFRDGQIQVKSYTSTLDGIEFFFKAPHEGHQRKFIEALENSKTSFGKPNFVSNYAQVSAVENLFPERNAQGGPQPSTKSPTPNASQGDKAANKNPFIAATAVKDLNRSFEQPDPGPKPTLVARPPSNWMVECSFGATEGKGFREIRYLPDQSRVDNFMKALREAGHTDYDPLSAPWKLDAKAYQSLHIAINNGRCTIHIDEVGFVIGQENGLIVTSGFLQHTVNELIYKTFGKWFIGKIPNFSQWLLDHTEVITPHAATGFRPPGPMIQGQPSIFYVGAQAHYDFINTPNAYVGVSATGIYDFDKKSFGWNVMGNVEFRHDWFGSK